jgi:predicted metal-dependent hydrolase
MGAKTINIDNLGPVLLEKSSRAKHINISIKPPAKIRVAVPRGVSYEKAESVARSKTNWIKKHLNRITKIIEQNSHLAPIDKEYARQYLTKRIEQLAKEHGFTYNKLYIKNQKTRWGSCSTKNNINLNMKLLSLPKELSDYVILHELVHTKVKSHAPEFWMMLDKHTGDAKGYHKKLKKYGLSYD